MVKFLIIDDTPSDRELITLELQKEFPDAEFELVRTKADFEEVLARGDFDVALIDYRLRWIDGLWILRQIKEKYPYPPVIMVTDTGAEEIAVEGMKSGLSDYVLKRHLRRLPSAVKESLEKAKLGKEHDEAIRNLRNSEERYRLLVESAQVWIFTFDLEGRYQSINREALELAGLTPEDVIGKSVVEIHSAEEGQKYLRHLKSVIETGERLVFEHPLNLKGKTYWHLDILYPIYGDDGQIKFVGGICHDITEKHQMETSLRQLNRALDTIRQCNQVLIRSTDESELLSEICRITVEVGGYHIAWIGFAERDEKKSVCPVAQAGFEEGYLDTVDISWADSERGRGPTGKAIRVGQPVICKNTLTDPDYALWRAEAQKFGYASAIALPLIVEGQTLGALNIYAAEIDAFDDEEVELLTTLASDLAFGVMALRARAERQRIEAELRETQRQVIQQERLRALGQLASGIVHDFNNVLSPILGYTDLMLTMPAILSDVEKVKSYLEMMRTAASGAVNVVKRLREFYRQREAGEAFFAVELNQVVKQAVDLTSPRWKDQAQAESITIDIETDLRDIPRVNGSEAELREALINLILNAVDAMPTGGTITIRTSSDAEHVSLAVQDTGIGMTDDVKEHCFDPFFTTKKDGTGLGLSMVYGVIQRHGGEINIENEPGEGTTFIISLPIPRAKKVQKSSKKTVVLPPSLHVLVVDDKQTIRALVTDFLRADGHTFQIAASGREALEKLRSARFDVVLTDQAMADMNGAQLARFIKRLQPQMPIIMLTGFADIMKEVGEMPEGVDCLVSKPTGLNQFREALAKVMSNE
ncbi:TPA: response regulator [Candidatus Poribacteria bacterium]|nr:response regulator [Candidatus Poribacteria bacterium]